MGVEIMSLMDCFVNQLGIFTPHDNNLFLCFILFVFTIFANILLHRGSFTVN